MTVRDADDTFGENMGETFHDAVTKLATFVDASNINESGTTISEFKAKYSHVLDRSERGSLEVITRHNRRYVILDEAQVLALTKNAHSSPMAADLLADLALPVAGENIPRSRAPKGAPVRLGRLPE